MTEIKLLHAGNDTTSILENFNFTLQAFNDAFIGLDTEYIFNATNLEYTPEQHVFLYALCVLSENPSIFKFSVNESIRAHSRNELLQKFIDSNSTLNRISFAKDARRENLYAIELKVKELILMHNPNKDASAVANVVCESLNNCFDHSQSEYPAFVGLFYYEDSNQLEAIIIDLGIGIPNSINNYFMKKNGRSYNDRHAMMWAVMPFNTSGSMPHNQGRGLDLLTSLLKTRGGSLHIYSGNVCYVQKVEDGSVVDVFTDNPINNMLGTYIFLRVNLQNLPDMVEDETFSLDEI